MQDFLNKYPLAIIPFIILFWCAILFLIAAVSGWRTLAQKFRLSSTFIGPTWGFQSAYMRWMGHYGNCLNVGADSVGLKLSIVFPFRPGHPPLFVPWSEIAIGERRSFLFMKQVKLLLGREEQIPFLISGRLAERIQGRPAAVGPSNRSHSVPRQPGNGTRALYGQSGNTIRPSKNTNR